MGSGSSISLNPNSTTTYYVRAEGSCNTTNCVSHAITVAPTSTAPLLITSTNSSICPGNSSILTVSGGFLAANDDYFGMKVDVEPEIQLDLDPK